MEKHFDLLFLFLLTSSLAGLFLSFFILAVSSKSWRNGGPLVDVLLSALGIFNVIRQIFLMANSIIFSFFPELLLLKVYYMSFYSIYAPLSCCTSWMTSWLCIFYCIKITQFKGSAFRFFEVQLSKMLHGLIVVSVLLSYLLITPFMRSLSPVYAADNCTLLKNIDYLSYDLSTTGLALKILCIFLPLILIVVSLGVTLTSLSIHVYRMKKSDSFSFAQIKGHLSAMMTMVLLLSLCLTFSFSQILLTLNSVPMSSLLYRTGLVFHYIFTLVQAIILILGNPKLRSAFKRIIKCQRNADSQPPE